MSEPTTKELVERGKMLSETLRDDCLLSYSQTVKSLTSRLEELERDRERLPEDVRGFIEKVTLHLQSSRSKTPAEHDQFFQHAYRLYTKYDVENKAAMEDKR